MSVRLERRGRPRGPGGPARMLVRYAGLTQPVFCHLVDRSQGGMRLLVPFAVPKGTVLYVREGAATPGAPWERAEVRWLRDRSERWEVGCACDPSPCLERR